MSDRPDSGHDPAHDGGDRVVGSAWPVRGGEDKVAGSWWPVRADDDRRPGNDRDAGYARGAGSRPRSPMVGLLFACLWLGFLVDPVVRGWQEHSVAGGVGIVATLAFASVYVVLFSWVRGRRRAGSPMIVPQQPAIAVLFVMTGLGVVMVLTLRDDGMAASVYLAVAAVLALPTVVAALVTVGLSVLVVVAFAVFGWQGGSGLALGVLAAGFAMWGIVSMMRRNIELLAERERNAELAIFEERARMARDLHDILGHSLTVITVKAELAGRLIDIDTERAHAEVADLERLARDALADVRRTAEGYREMSLAVEVVRARTALASAGVDADLPGSTEQVRSDLRDLFAWAVREGVTNVLRHSNASTCTITLEPARLVVSDDGQGTRQSAIAAQDSDVCGGHGLVGLRERAERSGATVRTRSFAGSGFTLEVAAGAQP